MEDLQETERRRNGGTLYNEVYSEEAISRFKQMVLTFYNQNIRKYYSILVDGETVVDKTSDGRKFDGYKDFIADHTLKIEVRMYVGNSFNCNRYIFKMERAMAGLPGSNNLTKVDVKEEIQKALAQQKTEYELSALKGKLKKKDKQLLKLQEDLEKAPKMDWDKAIDKTIGAISLLRGGAVGKGITQLGGTPSNNSNSDNEVTVEYEDADDSVNNESEQAKEVFKDLLHTQGLEKMMESLAVIKIIGENPDIAKKVTKMFNTKNNKDEQT